MVWDPPRKLIDLYVNDFDTEVGLTSLYSSGDTGFTFDVSNGKLVMDYSGTGGATELGAQGYNPSIARLLIEVKVDVNPAWVGIGLISSDGSKRIYAIYDFKNGVKKVEYRDGSSTTEITSVNETPAAPIYVRVVITGNYMIVFESTDGSTWTKKFEVDISTYLNLFDESVITDLVPSLGMGGDSTYNHAEFEYFGCWYFGGFGARDPSFIKTIDGMYWQYNGKYYAVVTGSGYDVQGAAALLVEIDDPEDLSTYTAKGLFVVRCTIDTVNKRLGDHPIRIVVDEDKGKAYLYLSRWVTWRAITTAEHSKLIVVSLDTLKSWLDSGGIITLDLTGADASQTIYDLGDTIWDMDIVYVPELGKYRFVGSNTIDTGYIAIYETTDPETVPYTKIAQTSDGNREGGVIIKTLDGIFIYNADIYNEVWEKRDIDLNLLSSISIPSPLGFNSWPVPLIHPGKVLGWEFVLEYDIVRSHGKLHIVDVDPTFCSGIASAKFSIEQYPSSINVTPSSSFSVNVTVANNGNTSGDAEVRLKDHNDNIVDTTTVTIDAGS